MRCGHFAFALAGLAAGAALADPVEDFYRGKTVVITVGMAPPDQHDNDARALQRHMGRYIPGNPQIVVQNMPGAGSLKATQYLATVAPKDGLAFGIVQRGVMMMPLLGYPEATFDPTKFSFVGSRAPETSIVVLWHEAKVKTIEQAMREVVILASAGGGADSNTMPFIYNDTLGTKFKTVIGYSGGGDMNLAMERREVDGRAGWSMGAMRGTHEDWYQEKKANIILQHALRKHAEIPNVPNARDIAKNDADRALIDLFAKRAEIGFPVFAPAGIPPDRLAALREAYIRTMRDPAYLVDAKAMQAEVDPIPGARMNALVSDVYATPRDIIERAKNILRAQGQTLN